MPEKIPKKMSDGMPDQMSDRMPDRMPGRISERMPDRMLVTRWIMPTHYIIVVPELDIWI